MRRHQKGQIFLSALFTITPYCLVGTYIDNHNLVKCCAQKVPIQILGAQFQSARFRARLDLWEMWRAISNLCSFTC